MDAKRFIAGTIVGGIVLFFVGNLIFITLAGSFYTANAGTATGVDRPEALIWAVLLGNVAYAALICYAMGARNASGLLEGAKIGAIVGFLMWVAVDFIFYGLMNLSNLTRTIVDSLLEVVHAGIGGAAIGLLAAKMKPAS
jgi:hypothetical protein